MKRLLAIILIMVLALPVCAKKHQSEEIITPQTQLEKRKYQTRTYQTKNSIQVLKAILNVLQDEGYLVYNVNSLLGFVYAVKDFDTTDPNIDISKEFGLSKSRLNYNGIKVATIETSANVTPYGDILRVRINFKRKLLNEYGNAQFIDDVSENEFYDGFYEKLNNALALYDEVKNKAETEVEKSEIEINSTSKTDETIVDPELMKKINDEINKIINSDAPTIPEVSTSENINTEVQEVEKVKNPNEEQLEEKVNAPEEEIKEEKTKPAEQKAEENTKESQEEQTEKINSETNTENSEISEEKEEITEEKSSKKEKKAKNKKNKDNSKENVEEETSVDNENKKEEITE